MTFSATKAQVLNRGTPPESFLSELVAWGRSAPEEIFSVNANPADIYAHIRPVLGPWEDVQHRRAAMLEVMRVHAGFESSWNWNEGVDTTNASSMSNISGQETGAWQVSYDSTALGWKATDGTITPNAMLPFAQANRIGTAQSFINAMKTCHPLAMEYVARLYRVNVKWAGPIARGEIDKWLHPDAVAEFVTLLTANPGTTPV